MKSESEKTPELYSLYIIIFIQTKTTNAKPTTSVSERVAHTPTKQQPGYTLLKKGRISSSSFYGNSVNGSSTSRAGSSGFSEPTPGVTAGSTRTAHIPKQVNSLDFFYIHLIQACLFYYFFYLDYTYSYSDMVMIWQVCLPVNYYIDEK